MNINRKLFFSVLVLFIILSIGSVSAAISDDISEITSTNDQSVVGDVVSADDGNTSAAENTSKTIEIDNTLNNDEIQGKIDEANNGDTVNFKNGTYENTNLIINKTLTLNGNGAVLTGVPNNQTSLIVVNGTTYAGIFHVINCNNTVVQGFNFVVDNSKLIRGGSNDGKVNAKTQSNVIIHNTNNVVFANNTVSGGRYGVFVTSAFTAPNRHTVVENNTISNVLGGGIISFGSPNSVIRFNTVINPYDHGIDVRHGTGPNAIVANNTVYGAQEGIYLMHSAGHICENNTLNHCNIGISCYGSSNIYSNYNKFTNNTQIGYMLGAGYNNITVGGSDDFTGLKFVPFPPTFRYNIVTAGSGVVGNTNGTYTDETQKSETNLTVVKEFKQTAVDKSKNETGRFFTATLLDDNGQPLAGKLVQIGFNGKIYNKTTDANGVARLQINLRSAGDYTFAVAYLGDGQNTGAFAVSTVRITKKPSRLTLTGNSAARVNAVKTLTVRLTGKSTLNSTYMNAAGKKVTLNVNGKTYTGTTNSNGVATFRVKISRAGTYTITTKFAGDYTYSAKTTTSKITVRR